MARQRSPDRDKAFEIYKASNGEKALVEIAKELNLKPSQIRKWKSQAKWDEQLKGNVTIAKRSITNVKNPETKAKLKKMLDDEELTEQDHMLKILIYLVNMRQVDGQVQEFLWKLQHQCLTMIT